MIDNYYLYKNIEELDLHGCNRYEAIVKVDSFINDNKKVVAYKLDLYNDGVTIIEI